MLIEQITEFQLRGLGPLAVHVLLQLVKFLTKQKSLRKTKIFKRIIFSTRILQEAMCLTSPTWTKSLTIILLHHNARF